jgi:hypothetical protein
MFSDEYDGIVEIARSNGRVENVFGGVLPRGRQALGGRVRGNRFVGRTAGNLVVLLLLVVEPDEGK